MRTYVANNSTNTSITENKFRHAVDLLRWALFSLVVWQTNREGDNHFSSIVFKVHINSVLIIDISALVSIVLAHHIRRSIPAVLRVVVDNVVSDERIMCDEISEIYIIGLDTNVGATPETRGNYYLENFRKTHNCPMSKNWRSWICTDVWNFRRAVECLSANVFSPLANIWLNVVVVSHRESCLTVTQQSIRQNSLLLPIWTGSSIDTSAVTFDGMWVSSC